MSRDPSAGWAIASILVAMNGSLLVGCATDDRVSPSESTETAVSALTAETAAPSVDDLAQRNDPELGLSMDTSAQPNRYIVVFKRGVAQKGVAGRTVPDVAKAMKKKHGAKLVRLYQHALDGAVMDLNAEELAKVKADERVDYVEEDRLVEGFGTTNNATWGIDRVDQRQTELNHTFNYPDNGGKGVHVYILDSGIHASDPEFGGRIVPEYDFVDNDNNPEDCHGHGTHVAGTVGSATYGVAKAATMHSVRVLNCGNGSTMAMMTAGVDYITAHHIKPAVVNASLGGSYSRVMNDAVARAVANGITFVAAAGNWDMDACEISPASAPEAITVGATEEGDRRATIPGTDEIFSNYGSCLDIFAPGKDITSTYLGNTTAEFWGTSMAAPHVTGSAALYLGLNPNATPAQVASALLSKATTGVITDAGEGSPNRLLYMGFFNDAACAGICSNPINITINGSYQSGNIGTGAGCYQTTSPIHSGNCGNFAGTRSLKVNGTTMACNNQNWSTVPGSRNNGFCITTTAGNYPWAFFTLW